MDINSLDDIAKTIQTLTELKDALHDEFDALKRIEPYTGTNDDQRQIARLIPAILAITDYLDDRHSKLIEPRTCAACLEAGAIGERDKVVCPMTYDARLVSTDQECAFPDERLEDRASWHRYRAGVLERLLNREPNVTVTVSDTEWAGDMDDLQALPRLLRVTLDTLTAERDAWQKIASSHMEAVTAAEQTHLELLARVAELQAERGGE